jgi:hypothetical protein
MFMKTITCPLWLCMALFVSTPGNATEHSPTPLTSRDPLAWLGPLPLSLDDASAGKAYERAMTKALAEVGPKVIKINARGFSCRKPPEVGPTPLLHAVDLYITEFPESRHGGPALDGLFLAAAQGNWLARGWVFNYLRTQQPRTAETMYRMAQLADWMRESKTGALYQFLAIDFAKSPLYPHLSNGKPAEANFEMYAALHHSYPSQYSVGRRLRDEKDKQMAEIGKQMMACATGALPGYQKLAEGDRRRSR